MMEQIIREITLVARRQLVNWLAERIRQTPEAKIALKVAYAFLTGEWQNGERNRA